MARRMRRLGAAAAAAAVLGGAGSAPDAAPAGPPASIGTHDVMIFDAGVVDLDSDGNLDPFTVNHNFRGSMMIGNGAGGFEDQLYELGMGQDRHFPGLESQPHPPMNDPGLYVELHGGRLILTAVGQPSAVTVNFLAPATVSERSRSSVQVERPGRRATVAATLRPGGRVGLRPKLIALPIKVTLGNGTSPAEVFVGSLLVSPAADRFRLTPRDRHAFAWGDVDGDGRLDAFVARGGLKGRIDAYRDRIADELLFWEGGSFDDRYSSSALSKGECRGRSAAAIDFDLDGRLDLFEGCEDTPPRLYRRLANGRFHNSSPDLKHAGVGVGVYRWVDLDGTGAALVAATRGRVSTFRLRPSGWRRAHVERTNDHEMPAALVTSDYDNDGDPDLFRVGAHSSELLENEGGRLEARSPGRTGLPRRGLSASWVDFDNDGLRDLEVEPRGIYLQQPDHTFDRVGGATPADDATRAVSAWPDVDSNGARDWLLFWQRRKDQPWHDRLDLAPDPASHWLEVDPDAAGALEIGARVDVTTGAGTWTGWIGESESSLRSQGHYRVYFALGDAAEADVSVTCTDGSEQQLGTVATDQVLPVSC